jgi:hypothetical protein
VLVHSSPKLAQVSTPLLTLYVHELPSPGSDAPVELPVLEPPLEIPPVVVPETPPVLVPAPVEAAEEAPPLPDAPQPTGAANIRTAATAFTIV